jgi:DNA-binding transcriptional LysR family regulator
MNTNDIELFLDIAHYESITDAARKRGISAANASAALQRLEKQLNAQLFIRSTRHLRLTIHGKCFLPHAEQMINSLQQSKQAFEQAGSLKGQLRITAPSDFGRHILRFWLDDYLEKHPLIACHLVLTDSLSNLYEDDIDVAIRYGLSAEPDFIVSPLIKPIHRIICASPKYLANHGQIESISDLKSHRVLLLTINNQLEECWTLYQGERVEKVKLSSQYNSNDAEVIRQWALQGKGLVLKANLDVIKDIEAGRLVRVLPEYQGAQTALSFITLERPSNNAIILSLKQFLQQKAQTIYLHC